MNSPQAAGPAGEPFSVRDCDRYAEHLALISMQHQLVLATEDVHNEFGVLLLKEGTPLGTHAIEKMRGHRLNRPVDQVLELRRRLDARELVVAVRSLVESAPDVRAVDERFHGTDRVRHLCHTLDWPQAMLQKLTVLQIALPRIFHRALFTAWFGATLAGERDLDATTTGLVFQAGLFHDLGLLHVEPGLADKKTDIAPGEWVQIQSHVSVGAELVAQGWPEADPRLGRIVAEHHERHDGAGYPLGRVAEDLDPASGIVALADMIHELRFPADGTAAGGLAGCLPYLRVNRRTFDAANYAPAARLLLAARSAAEPPADRQRPSLQGLIDANRSLGVLLGELPAAATLLESLPVNRVVRSLRQLVVEVQRIALAAGLGSDALGQWLQQALASGHDDEGIDEIMLTMREVLWLVRRIDRLLLEHASAAGPEASIPLKDLSMRVNAELTRAWRRFEARTVAG